MSIYTLDTDFVGENLMPPQLRTAKHLAWLKVLLRPLKCFINLIFNKFQDGDTSNDWKSVTTYTFCDTVKWTDKSIYMCIVASSLNVDPSNSSDWIKVNNIFIGANERIKYSSQKLLFEYILNRYFETVNIYIDNNFVESDVVFLMGNSGETSSLMPNNSVNQIQYLGNTPNYVTAVSDFTIYVPLAFYNSLGTYKEELIRAFADKYVLAGITYNVTSYI